MITSDRLLLQLIRCAVNPTSSNAPIIFDDTDWNHIINQSARQGISALTIDGLQNYLTSRPSSKAFANESAGSKLKRMQWIASAIACERIYTKHKHTMACLARTYDKANIRMMVIKGFGLSLNWPIPCHRPAGDLDIYNFGKYKEADDYIAKSYHIKIDKEHEHHTIFTFNGVMVENHYDFINTKAHRDAPAIEQELKRLAQNDYTVIEVEGAPIYLPAHNFNAIFLMRHMGQHFAGEHLNLRQVLDWAFFVRANSANIDWAQVLETLHKIGLRRFADQINAICVDYLGFSAHSFPIFTRDTSLQERILMDILHPEFSESKPHAGLLPVLHFKLRRWWHNRWKHTLVYKEKLLPMFITQLWSHLRRYKTIKD